MLVGIVGYLVCVLGGALWWHLGQTRKTTRWAWLSGVPMIVGLGAGLYFGRATGFAVEGWKPWAVTFALFMAGVWLEMWRVAALKPRA